MAETLSALFQKSKGAPIEIDGETVRPSFRLNLGKGSHRFMFRRLSAKAVPLQGIRLKVKAGHIETNGKQFQDVILWSDTSPEQVELIVHSKSGCEVIVWNSWKIDDLIQAWVGNAGLLVDQEQNVITLHCSDGTGATDFSDLVVQIERCE